MRLPSILPFLAPRLFPGRLLSRCSSLIAAIALCLTFQATARARDVVPPSERPTAPDWQLKDLNGKTVSLSDFKGKVVILDFWATWCPPCRKEIPGFIDLQKKYADKGVVVVGVALDEQGASAIEPFVKRMGMNYPVVIGDARIASIYGGVEAIPTTFVIDRQGKIVTGHQGYADVGEFEADIKPLL